MGQKTEAKPVSLIHHVYKYGCGTKSKGKTLKHSEQEI